MDKTEMLKKMVDRFLSWPLPQTVCSDLCATAPDYPHPRSGTNLLTATEAEAMLAHVVEPLVSQARENFLNADSRIRELEAEVTGAAFERDQAREEIARLKGKRGNAEYRATVARRALEYSDRFACECEDGSNVCWSCAASDALDAMDDALAALDAHDQGERGGGG